MTSPDPHVSMLARPAKLLLVKTTGCVLAMTLLASSSQAHNNEVSVTETNGKRCIVSNGLPDHRTGKFPNSGNPNTISKQSINLCITASPKKRSKPRKVRGSIGVGINGVQFRPGTADYYDSSSPRGHSRDRSSGWNLDGLGARKELGMDGNNAHVDQRGLYHYHGVANALVKSGKGTMIGWAADGFEIHYLSSKRRSGYKLKPGKRPSAPGGKYDGTYVEDWKYFGGSGTLDRCNGGKLNGKFVYFATETFPFLPHCLWGTISKDFEHRGSGRQLRTGKARDQPANRRRPRAKLASSGQGPPQEAQQACYGKPSGTSCAFNAPNRNQRIIGRCRRIRSNTKACVPARGAFVRP